MVSKKAVRNLINRTEIVYRQCWDTLSSMKRLDPVSDAPARDQLLEFQPQLASALFDLDALYREIRAEEKSLIARKRRLTPAWFRRRMKTLATYRGALKQAMGIGRGIGDAFAWLFYAKEREYLNNHLNSNRQEHTPPGIGGRGELEFLRQVKGVGNQLAIYHGTTTFLRAGDISLFDIKRGKIVGLGELKTSEITPGQLSISLHTITSQQPDLPSQKGPPAESRSNHLPPAMEQRLKRQLDRMEAALKMRRPKEKRNLTDAAHLQELDEFAQQLLKSSVVYRKIGDGLLLCGIRRQQKTSLATKLMGESRIDFDKKLHEVTQQAISIVDRSSPDNSLVTGMLDLAVIPGTTPIFWWPINIEFLH